MNTASQTLLKSLGLTDDQLNAAAERERNVIVTAGAGSGKTRTLVARYLALLAEGLHPRRVTAITFTEKAAREMRSRVRSALTQQIAQAADPAERQRWSLLDAQMDSARIGTIHSLCAEILRSHPAEAGVDPRFNVLEDGLAATLRAQAVSDTLTWLVSEPELKPLLTTLSAYGLQTLLANLLARRLEAEAAFGGSPSPLARLQTTLEKLLAREAFTHPLAALRLAIFGRPAGGCWRQTGRTNRADAGRVDGRRTGPGGWAYLDCRPAPV